MTTRFTATGIVAGGLTIPYRVIAYLLGSALVAVVAITVFGPQTGLRGAPPNPSEIGKLIAFEEVVRGEAQPPFADAEVTDPAALERYLAPLPPPVAGRVREKVRDWDRGADGDRLLAFRVRAGSGARGGQLVQSYAGVGVERLFVGLTGYHPAPEDGPPTYYLAVFAVRTEVINAPLPAGEGTLEAFVRLPGAPPPGAQPGVLRVEVTDPAALEQLLATVDAPSAASVRAALSDEDSAAAGKRLVAFVLPGCAESTAVLFVERGGRPYTRHGLDALSPSLAGGHRQECSVPTWFVAVFAVPADRWPR